MRVRAPWLRICLLDDEDDGNYVLPNIDNVVLGGTHQHNDWDTVRILNMQNSISQCWLIISFKNIWF